MRVLIVDDDRELLGLLSRYLERQCIDCLCAADGREALGLLESEQVDLVVTDLCMPELSGDELLDGLRAPWRHGAVPVIVITAFSDSETEERLLRCGASFCLSKPVDFSQLLSLIHFAAA